MPDQDNTRFSTTSIPEAKKPPSFASVLEAPKTLPSSLSKAESSFPNAATVSFKEPDKAHSSLNRQEAFLKEHRRHHHQVTAARALLFITFVLLWELSAGIGWIDSFFFSSPSRVIHCFTSLCANGSMPLHIGITLLETIASFLLVFLISLSGRHFVVVLKQAL